MNYTYVLSAAFLYSFGVSEKDIGHYTAAIKVNNKWEIYDDLKSKAMEVTNQKCYIIHALLFLKDEKSIDQAIESTSKGTLLKSQSKMLPKIGFLRNTMLSKVTQKIKGKTVKLKNSCAFDSLIQVI